MECMQTISHANYFSYRGNILSVLFPLIRCCRCCALSFSFVSTASGRPTARSPKLCGSHVITFYECCLNFVVVSADVASLLHRSCCRYCCCCCCCYCWLHRPWFHWIFLNQTKKKMLSRLFFFHAKSSSLIENALVFYAFSLACPCKSFNSCNVRWNKTMCTTQMNADPWNVQKILGQLAPCMYVSSPCVRQILSINYVYSTPHWVWDDLKKKSSKAYMESMKLVFFSHNST